jgi:hypothetical protein
MIASDYFVIPMSVDVFSLMALENINLSLSNWKEGLESGLTSYQKKESEAYKIEDSDIIWNLKFAGYVMQQYKAKTVRGEKIHVHAYEKISKQIPEKIKKEISSIYSKNIKDENNLLGEVENLHSLVPMSQTAKSPIFSLKSKDGVVGAHFTKVSDAKLVYQKICERFLTNIGDDSD